MFGQNMKLQSWNGTSATFIADPEKGQRPEIRSVKIGRGAWEAGGRPLRISIRIDAIKEKPDVKA